MGQYSDDFPIDDSTGTTLAIPADLTRTQITFQNQGPDRVFISFNEPCTTAVGLYLDMDTAYVENSKLAKYAVFMRCEASGETATVSCSFYPT